jgi:NAD(P)-dependent dehydrogenase (short-subunit alcohol dehydrogenase family)
MVSIQPCHLSQSADCQALVDFAVRSFGQIDVLFSNAAMANWLKDISDDRKKCCLIRISGSSAGPSGARANSITYST